MTVHSQRILFSFVLLTWCPSASCSSAASTSSEVTRTARGVINMRVPEVSLEECLHKSNGITVTEILKKADEIGALGIDTDDLMEGATPRPMIISNIKINDSCSDKIKVALQMGVAPEDLFVEDPLPPQSGEIKTRAGLKEPASTSACSASAINYLTASTDFKNDTDAMLGASRCETDKLPISYFNSSVDYTNIDAQLGGNTTTIKDQHAKHRVHRDWHDLRHRPSAIVSGSQHLPEGAALPQGDTLTSPAMDRCAKREGGVWVNPGGGDRRYSG